MSKKEKQDKSNPNNLEYEKKLWENGINYIAGVDECGRGPFSGPVVACAVIMPKEMKIHRLTDSKKLAKREHTTFSNLVKESCIGYGIGIASVEEIDELNIKNASRLAMKRAIENLPIVPEYILVDGTEVIDTDIPQEFIIKGDDRSHSIASAAIVAKVYRDELMAKLDEEYNFVYGWSKNAGYQTKAHIEACYEHGLTPHHRTSWKTINLFKK